MRVLINQIGIRRGRTLYNLYVQASDDSGIIIPKGRKVTPDLRKGLEYFLSKGTVTAEEDDLRLHRKINTYISPVNSNGRYGK